MRPESIKKLQENIPELKELIAFLASEAAKLNTLVGLKDMPAADRAEVVSGRIWASEAINAMLAPLIGDFEKPTGINPEEFVV